MTILEPVCTCAVPGINGCAKHTWPTPDPEVIALALRIKEGVLQYADEDAARVAEAFLQTVRR